MGIDAVHFAGFDQRCDHGPVFGSGVVSCEQGVLAVQGDGADGAFDGVVVVLDAALREEAAKAVAVFCDVGKGLAQGRLCRGAVPPDGQSRYGVTAADLGLDGVEVADEQAYFVVSRVFALFGGFEISAAVVDDLVTRLLERRL